MLRRLSARSDAGAGFIVTVGEAERWMVGSVLLGIPISYFLAEGFLESVFLAGAVRGLTRGDFSFLSLSNTFMYLIYNKLVFYLNLTSIYPSVSEANTACVLVLPAACCPPLS